MSLSTPLARFATRLQEVLPCRRPSAGSAQRRTRRTRSDVATGVLSAAAVAAGTFALTTPSASAQVPPVVIDDIVLRAGASVTTNGCTAKPERRVEISRQQAWEQDNGKPGDVGPNDALGSWSWMWRYNLPSWSKTMRPEYRVDRWDTAADPDVELFQRARLRVCTFDASVCGPWVSTGDSPVRVVVP